MRDAFESLCFIACLILLMSVVASLGEPHTPVHKADYYYKEITK